MVNSYHLSINTDNFEKHLLGDGLTEVYLFEPWHREGIIHGFIGKGVNFSAQSQASQHHSSQYHSAQHQLSQHYSLHPNRIAQLLGLNEIKLLKQVHSAKILTARILSAERLSSHSNEVASQLQSDCSCAPQMSTPQPGIPQTGDLPEADGFLWPLEKNSFQGSKSGYGIKTADCVPILVRSDLSAAILHAGWRGIAANILESCLEKMVAEHQEKISTKNPSADQPYSKPLEIEILIGPCACADCYEVGLDVITALSPGVAFKDSVSKITEDRSSAKAHDAAASGKFLLDMPHTLLKRAVAFCERINRSGQDSLIGREALPPPVIIKRFSSLPICTMHEANFHSYRRDRELSGRNISFMA